ncbi:2-octaprenyl-6-methoxyphenyl hydroxylase [Coxiella burnetii]|uniref:2-octaprenyl-6-methoxyphenyl hydroxylase n=1 Tax=Coxiella burnetii TaxID=777 RepID=UPI0005926B51|nr:2-octaprenyl-6-methoxyphenyl hydroxylase [Coxiella burnetii]ATN73619.1 2-octaprenyl-3-methyl-6-methoxy-1,4-benzoquinol hydroxylase [Coxiella burnetii]ATN75528.1 2-octaprenyl-3-methyl-6-methoxy-1,4-benzoquinol hydroxylase [Coxiella burnetii]ATN77441.1 2-octaprenyl-3-methyl-6-methoxy-1,4-benzoquinol hydroxylase [Coxiella burnetii]ATN79356.1 2-octaprenyl-3-methyl-6-methoxy-1,4-benzoquinol hydroxylase [Coxiella burnetii]OYK92569.1 2-octaprenyl-6-methoxyphenyl hydroxylase [Coxiella burnetii]
MNQTDIIIIGAGLVGTSVAVALQGHGIKIKILEHHLPSAAVTSSNDVRPLTLSFGSYQILKNLGVEADLANEACPISTVHVSDQGALGALRFRASEFNVPALGYVVSFAKLQQSLYQRAALQKNAEIVPISTIDDIQCNTNHAQVTFSTINGQQQLQADLLIAADGTHSTARRLLKIPVEEENRNEVALIALLRLKQPHNHIAYERFTSQGTLALLPLFQANQCRLVWTLPKTKADEIEQLSDDEFRAVLHRGFKPYIGAIQSVERGKRFPLQMLIAQEQVRPSFVMLGNASHTLYPIAAQGFNLGLRDAAVLSEVLIDARRQLKPLGDIRFLQEYSRWRKTDQARITGLTRGLSQWFGVQLPLANQARGLGLLATGLLPPFKKRLAKRLMGLSGRLPQLMRGLKLDDAI